MDGWEGGKKGEREERRQVSMRQLSSEFRLFEKTEGDVIKNLNSGLIHLQKLLVGSLSLATIVPKETFWKPEAVGI